MTTHASLTRRGFLAGGLGMAAASLTGCSLGTSSDDRLNVLTIGDPFFYALRELLPEFERQAGTRVNLEGVDYDTLNARSTNSFLTRQSDIDVISPDSMWLSRFAENEWLLELDDLISRDADEVRIDDFVPATLHSLSEWRGHIYTLPAAAYASAVLYRPSVFRALDLEPPPRRPDDAWTWKEYLERIRAIDGKTVAGKKMRGTVICAAGPQPVTHMYSQVAASHGVRWFERFPEKTPWDFTPRFDTPQSVASLQYWKDLYAASPPQSINFLWFDAGTSFSGGGIGMFYHWTPYAYLVQRTEYMGSKRSPVVGDYAIGALPRQPGVEPVGNIGGYAFGIGARTRKRELAWRFVKWASSAGTQRRMALLKMRQFSDFARTSLYDDPALRRAYPYLPTQLEVMREGDGKLVRPPVQNYTTLETAIGRSLNTMLSSDVDAGKTATSLQRAADEIMTDEQFVPWKGSSYADTRDRTERLMTSLAA